VPSICFTTVCSGNHFAYFVPVFIYSTKKAYPDAGVKIFVKGKLKEEVKQALELVRQHYPDGWEVLEGQFDSYPMRKSTCNCLRFLLPGEFFKGYDYVLVRDVDFVTLPHQPSHLRYFAKRMKACKLPYFGTRGPYRYPRRYNINGHGWKYEYSRIAGGTVMLSKAWFKAVKGEQSRYRHALKHSQNDGRDHHVAGVYREYDEVMLQRMCKAAHFRIPTKKSKGPDGRGVSKIYRDIHLGDFAKRKRNFKRVRKKIARENVKLFMRLEQDPVWQEIKKLVGKNGKVRVLLRRARKHIRSR
jgi:hypothetical protein